MIIEHVEHNFIGNAFVNEMISGGGVQFLFVPIKRIVGLFLWPQRIFCSEW